MNISWSALALLLIFITPAFLLLSIFRIQFFPKIRTIGPTETTLFLVCSVLSVLINIDLLADMANHIVNTSFNYIELLNWERVLLSNLFTPFPFVFKFSAFLNNHFNFHIPGYNFFVFVFELHFRTAIIGILFTIFIELIFYSFEYYEYLPYRSIKVFEKKKGLRFFFYKSFNSIINLITPYRFDSEQSRYIQEKRNRQWIVNKINELRTSFYHPWTIITSTNKLREILMVDILTKEGSLYSGKLSTWVPDKNGISAISVEYVLKYHPNSDLDNGQRKKYLIKNHGDLVIPSSEICTYHFWEIRRHFSCTITVKNKYDLEVVKWYLLLSFVHDDFFNKIVIQFDVSNASELQDVTNKLNNWINDNNINIPEGLIDFHVDKTIIDQASKKSL